MLACLQRYRFENAIRINGFTLAELLIALAILGVIATFAIPKVLVAQQSQQNRTIAKEVASMVSGAFQAYTLEKTLKATTEIDELTPYMNYVRVDTSGTMDDVPGDGTWTCSASMPCLVLHNGAKLAYVAGDEFGSTSNNYSIWFTLDPDGKGSIVQGISFFIYANGRIRTTGSLDANTYINGGGPVGPDATKDPSWFSWN